MITRDFESVQIDHEAGILTLRLQTLSPFIDDLRAAELYVQDYLPDWTMPSDLSPFFRDAMELPGGVITKPTAAMTLISEDIPDPRGGWA